MIGLGIPLVVAAAAALLMGLVHRRARPAVAAVSLTVGAVGSLAAAVVLLVLYAVAFALDPARVEACRWLVGHHEPHEPTVGIALAVLLAFGALRGWTWWKERRRVLADSLPAMSADVPVAVVDDDAPLAYAHPSGSIVVSRGLMAQLSPEQRLVVVAHERAHVVHRHHRYLAAAELAAAVLPLLAPLARAVRLHTERWADEAAVCAVGGDRRLVAATIAQVAMARSPGLLSGVGGDVTARVTWLLEPRPAKSWVLVAAASVVAAGALVQVHHLGDFIAHVV